MSAFSKSILLGGIVGLCWFVVQFLASELVYRVAYFEVLPMEINDALYEISDGIAFPAGVLYDVADESITRQELEQFTQDSSLEPEIVEKAESLLTQFHTTEDTETWTADAYGFLSEHDIYPEVSIWLEYSIYVGTCLVWGILIGLATTTIAYNTFSGTARDARMPPPSSSNPVV